jgi:serine/threonine protein kinase/tetratricopeptide (TPR) repeat protein
MIGQTVSHFRIVEKLGEGGMGVVYRAEDLHLQRPVALKFLSTVALSSVENRQRFLQEAQAAAGLSHPNIATVHEFIETDGMSFIAMEFVEGSTLERLIGEGPLPLDRSTEYAVAVADALALAHRRGVIHRDIKPSNIMVFGEGEDPARRGLKVLDFGVARIEGAPGLTVAGTLVGTLAYMSPEQAAGDPTDQRTDLFSLGTVFYEMVTGTPPFSAETMAALLYKIVWEDPLPPRQLRPDLPPALEEIILRALAKDADRRYQSMREFLAGLAAYQYQPETVARRSGPGRTSIAVLPFEDMSPDGESGFLADGVVEELVLRLSRNPRLRVMARTSVMHYKGSAADVRDVGRDLGVSFVLGGSLRRSQDQLRVTAQLIDTADGSHLWAEKFDGSMEDIFQFQEGVADQVAGALNAGLAEAGGEAPQPRPVPTANTKAYEYFIQGRLLLDTPAPETLDRSVMMLRRALELDPAMAAAFGSLGCANLWYVDTGLRPDPKYLVEAEEAARRALALEPRQPDALYVLANLALKDARIEDAFEGFSRVLDADPGHGQARLWRACLLMYSSFHEEALLEADRLLALDPFAPLAHWLRSTVRLHQGRFDAAVAEYEQVVAEVPTKLAWLALAYRYQGNLNRAWESAERLKTADPEGVLWKTTFGFLKAAEGKQDEVLEYLDNEVRDFGWGFFIVTYWVASLYALVGEADEAFRWLDRSIELGVWNHRFFEIDPNLQVIRDDPRFHRVLGEARGRAHGLGILIKREIQEDGVGA